MKHFKRTNKPEWILDYDNHFRCFVVRDITVYGLNDAVGIIVRRGVSVPVYCKNFYLSGRDWLAMKLTLDELKAKCEAQFIYVNAQPKNRLNDIAESEL